MVFDRGGHKRLRAPFIASLLLDIIHYLHSRSIRYRFQISDLSKPASTRTSRSGPAKRIYYRFKPTSTEEMLASSGLRSITWPSIPLMLRTIVAPWFGTPILFASGTLLEVGLRTSDSSSSSEQQNLSIKLIKYRSLHNRLRSSKSFCP